MKGWSPQDAEKRKSKVNTPNPPATPQIPEQVVEPVQAPAAEEQPTEVSEQNVVPRLLGSLSPHHCIYVPLQRPILLMALPYRVILWNLDLGS